MIYKQAENGHFVGKRRHEKKVHEREGNLVEVELLLICYGSIKLSKKRNKGEGKIVKESECMFE